MTVWELRQDRPHMFVEGGFWCPVRGWDYFLVQHGRCPGCGAEVEDEATEAALLAD